jgi:competence protein ComEC
MPKWVAMGLAVSVSAQLFCFPVLLSLQGGVPTYSLLANLICEPLVAPITILGLLGILFLWCPPISSLIFWLASVAAWPIAATAKFLSAFPFATLPWRLDIWGVIAAAAVVIAILVAIFGKKRSTQNLSWLVVFSIFACSIGLVLQQAVRISLWPMVDWQVASCDVGQGDATVIRDGEAIALIDVGRDEKKIDSCLSKLGVTQIDLLVLTHFDADHVNGLAGAINQRVIGEAMLTSYFDERPGADFSRTQLTTAHIPILNAEQGLEGLLGSVTWRVLSPSRTATEAEDANDGSITMLWHFYDFQLITLADLGEKGQQRLAASVNTWWNVADLPLVMKVSHHGSADQYSEFLEWLKPKVALISVGARNGYGHPTKRTLDTLNRTGSVVLRTDLLGSIALKNENGDFELSYSGSS